MRTAFAKSWDHQLQVRDLLGDDPLPPAHETIEKGRKIVERIHALQERLQSSDALLHDLDQVVEEFEQLEEVSNPYEARDVFNTCLGRLYDEADAGKRVWIE